MLTEVRSRSKRINPDTWIRCNCVSFIQEDKNSWTARGWCNMDSSWKTFQFASINMVPNYCSSRIFIDSRSTDPSCNPLGCSCFTVLALSVFLRDTASGFFVCLFFEGGNAERIKIILWWILLGKKCLISIKALLKCGWFYPKMASSFCYRHIQHCFTNRERVDALFCKCFFQTKDARTQCDWRLL